MNVVDDVQWFQENKLTINNRRYLLKSQSSHVRSEKLLGFSIVIKLPVYNS